MGAIDEHVVHDGKGKTRTTRCRHCSKLFTSRSKDRWRQHMRGCDSLPPEFRHLFSSYERKPYARLSLSVSEAASEAPLEQPASPGPCSESDSAPSSPVTPASVVSSPNVTEVTPAPAVGSSSPPAAENSLLRAVDPVFSSVAASATDFLGQNSEKMTEILLIHGPCSFMRSAWTGGDVTKADLLREVQNLAVEQGVSLVTQESNHEGTILDWLLNAKENEVIVLCWVGRLLDSPTVLRALELIRNRVVIISPRGVDHGVLPSSVVGVLSGFGQLSFNLALAAAKNLNAQQCT
ncbi:hypothetical protein PF005_g27092 [Phytophthora fragariae]|uniref:3-dehydroquinate dehydratase n=1 Tax=Phytophthora fragariae TaxID=53985 RepID=A0A6A3W6X2_9STRA|nr:hypothetical protein PF003_g14618 [Phytophthora fragariae]KAE8922783.1 hypothetical protein PF009_g26957 [Phytophthora fragariae]KAE8973620.1 hypothetical protein PF011_g25180 [Phytophthora fragariae]KAE9069543.1 hypothetical protein PF010_g26624 [Phytophthora fragariae]KAE9072184.1 hypothetical protein PF007_g26274 [Phytophthora fragariae]